MINLVNLFDMFEDEPSSDLYGELRRELRYYQSRNIISYEVYIKLDSRIDKIMEDYLNG